MDYEKRYKDALERARKLCDVADTFTSYDINTIFPELKESEDEIVRREIEQLIQCMHDADPRKGRWIAWLEKQGEQKQLYIRFGEIPTDEKSKIYQGEIEVGTEKGVSVYPAFKTSEGDIVLGLSLPITKTTLYTQQHLIEYDDRPCYLVNGDYVGKDTDGQPLIKNVSIIEKIGTYRVKEKKQCEQKFFDYENANIQQKDFASKVEPKFKVGDWIVNNKRKDVFLIKSFNKNGYCTLEDIKGNITLPCLPPCESDSHIWTIKDAKDGDVLWHSDSASNGIFIFKEIRHDGKVLCYCDYDSEDHFCTGKHHTCCWSDDKYIKPATKEQRDTLVKAMTDAGYTFDFEKKELKKTENKKSLLSDFFNAEYERGKADIQKPVYNEEDENTISDAEM